MRTPEHRGEADTLNVYVSVFPSCRCPDISSYIIYILTQQELWPTKKVDMT